MGVYAQNPSGTVGPYQVLKVLGRGGMGEVLLAHDPRLERKVAIKRILFTDNDLRARFRREAKLTANLQHPTIVQVFDLIDEGDSEFIVMEYVQGRTLAEFLAESGPHENPHDGLRIAYRLALGIAYAHVHSVIHRDLKTENVILSDDGSVKITDFGIARRIGTDGEGPRDTTLTAAGAMVGTCRCMAPEIVFGDPVDQRADIFSFGVLLYELFSGVSPFLGKNRLETLFRITTLHQPALDQHHSHLPDGLSLLVDKLLSKDPSLRPTNMQLVAEQIFNLAKFSSADHRAAAEVETFSESTNVPTSDDGNRDLRHPPKNFFPFGRGAAADTTLTLDRRKQDANLSTEFFSFSDKRLHSFILGVALLLSLLAAYLLL